MLFGLTFSMISSADPVKITWMVLAYRSPAATTSGCPMKVVEADIICK